MRRPHDPSLLLHLVASLLLLVACGQRRPDESGPAGAPTLVRPATAAPPASSAQRGIPMIDVQPSSRSLIVRATHILVAHVKTATEGPWTQRDDGTEDRVVSLALVLDEVVKGHVTQRPGDTFTLDAKQVRMGEAWGPMPGVWSPFPVAPGTPVIAFGRTSAEDAAAVFNDPGCAQLTSPAAASADIHLAAQIDAGGLDSAGAVALATPRAANVQNLFADYLWARYEASAMADVTRFEPIARFLEDAALNRVARATLVMALPTSVLAATPPSHVHVSRLAIAFFHLLGAPFARDLQDNLVGTYLPNLLDLANKDARTADQVFEDHPGEKARALQAVTAYGGPQPKAPLLQWLQR